MVNNYNSPGGVSVASITDSEHMRRWEGQLNKFTNVVKGWQYRWFVLEPAAGAEMRKGFPCLNSTMLCWKTNLTITRLKV